MCYSNLRSGPHICSGLNCATTQIIILGKPPHVLSSYILGSSTIEAVDHWLVDRDEVLQALRDNLQCAMTRMKAQANKHMCEMQFQVGQWCYIKLQPHKQILVLGQCFTKLSKRFYGPFKIIKWIGLVAYKLDLPEHCKIHPTFHISVLKLCPNPDMAPPLVFPSTVIGNQPLVMSLAVLNSRIVKRGSVEVPQVLVQWDGLPDLEDTSWDDLSNFRKLYPAFHLEERCLLERRVMIRCRWIEARD